MPGLVQYLRNAVKRGSSRKEERSVRDEATPVKPVEKPVRIAEKPAEVTVPAVKEVPKGYALKNCDRVDFLVGPSIGQGSFATVHIGKEHSSGREVAVKIVKSLHDIEIVDKDGPNPEEAYRDVLRAMKMEATLIAGLGVHPNIVQIVGVAEDCAVIIMEKALIDLYTLLRKQAVLSLPVINCWTRDILNAVNYMHQMRLVHQDIKSSNVLIFPDATAKVCDFGLARRLDESMPVDRELVTLWYRPPELLMGAAAYTPRVDEWGVGCVALEMLTGAPPFRGKPGFECACTQVSHHNFNSDQLRKIFSVLGTPPAAAAAHGLALADPEDVEFLAGMACTAHFTKWPTYPRTLEKLIATSCEGLRNPPRPESMASATAATALTAGAARVAAEAAAAARAAGHDRHTDTDSDAAAAGRDFSEEVEAWKELVGGLLHFDPARRLTARRALSSARVFQPAAAAPAAAAARSESPARAAAAAVPAELPSTPASARSAAAAAAAGGSAGRGLAAGRNGASGGSQSESSLSCGGDDFASASAAAAALGVAAAAAGSNGSRASGGGGMMVVGTAFAAAGRSGSKFDLPPQAQSRPSTNRLPTAGKPVGAVSAAAARPGTGAGACGGQQGSGHRVASPDRIG